MRHQSILSILLIAFGTHHINGGKKLRNLTVNHILEEKSTVLQWQPDSPDSSKGYEHLDITTFQAFQLGAVAFLLKWTLPLGNVRGYNIHYKEIVPRAMGDPIRIKEITDPYAIQAKLPRLKPNTTYELCIGVLRELGEGKSANQFYELEGYERNANIFHRTCTIASTKADDSHFVRPDEPSFKCNLLPIENNILNIKVIWLPDIKGNPGLNFQAQYCLKGTASWRMTREIENDDFVIIENLSPYETYEIAVSSIEEPFYTSSAVEECSRGLDRPEHRSESTNYTIFVLVSFIMVLGFLLIFLVYYKFYRHKFPVHLVSYDAAKKFTPRTLESLNDQISRRAVNNYQRQNGYESSYGEEENNSIYYLSKFEEGNVNCINPDLMLDEQADLLPYDRRYEFPRNRLQLGVQIGTGAFGIVFKATAKGILPQEDETTVAVKMVNSIAGYEVIRALTLELKILVHLGRHLNVVNLLGAVTVDLAKRELMLIVEYCPHGNLQTYLIRNRAYFVDQINREDDSIDSTIMSRSPMPTVITTTDLLIWSFQIARGMHYLASRKVLHGDLAARNVLLGDDNVVKICDFGLARSMYKTGNYQIKTERALPFKWLALESISDLLFTTYSDIWSFGVVLWELFSLGASPYPGMNAGTLLYKKLKDGYRMEKPVYATHDIYEIMQSCWREDPNSRPLFDKLEEHFKILLDESVSAHYITLNEPYLIANRLHSNENDYVTLMMGCPNEKPPPVPQDKQPTLS